MADKDKEDSVLFSLKELRRIGPESQEEEPPADAAPVSQARRAAPGPPEGSEQEVAALQLLRERVAAARADVEQVRQGIASEKKRAADLTQREAYLRDSRAKGVVPPDLVPPPPVILPPEFEEERKRGLVMKPAALAAAIVLSVGAVAGLAAYAFLRKPDIQTTYRTVTIASARALTTDSFESEIDWLDQPDLAPEPAVAPPPKRSRRRRRRRWRRRRSRRRKSTAKKQPSIVLPTRPKKGFVY